MKAKPLTLTCTICLLLTYPLWALGLKFVAIGALFTCWVLVVGSILIEYAKAGAK